MSSNNSDTESQNPSDIQVIGEQLREKNLGYYDFKNKICRVHKIPLIQYQTEQENSRPWHCQKCIPIPNNWRPIEVIKDETGKKE